MKVTAFNYNGLITYSNENINNKETDSGNNTGNIERTKCYGTLNGVNRNAEKMQRGKGNYCEENKLPKCFPFVSHKFLHPRKIRNPPYKDIKNVFSLSFKSKLKSILLLARKG